MGDQTLGGETIVMMGKRAELHAWPVPILGQDSNGRPVWMKLNDDGTVSATTVPAASTSTTAATLTQAYKTVAASGTPEALVASTTLVESVTITAQKNRTTANTGTVWIGFSATNDTQLRALAPGESVTYVAPDGKKLQLTGFYVDVATAGDGVLFETGN